MTCIFCKSDGPFSTVEHIIPESLGNDQHLLTNCVCDACQSYFGTEVEKYVLEKSPIAVWRVLLGIETKKGNLPTANLSQPKAQKGRLPAIHSLHTNLTLTAQPDFSVMVNLHDEGQSKNLDQLDVDKLQFVLTPMVLCMLGRFLCKVGIELIAKNHGDLALGSRFDEARKFARYGSARSTWPLFYCQQGDLSTLRKVIVNSTTMEIEISCFSIWIGQLNDAWCFQFRIGTDIWGIFLDERISKTFVLADSAPNVKKLWYDQAFESDWID